VRACLQRSKREKEGGRESDRVHFYACKGVHTLFTGQRERERKEERERQRERCRIWLLNLINNHKVKKEMTGASAPFSYLVQK
jgi:hypothetical protein